MNSNKKYILLFRILVLLIIFVMSVGCAVVFVPDVFPRKSPLMETKIESAKTRFTSEKILILDIDGIISSTESVSALGIRDEGTVEEVKQRLKRAERDKSIKAVILRLNTPGGGVTASDIIYKELMEYKKNTGVKIIACMMDVAASGGYYVAMSADKIIAHPTTVTGSIGVIAQVINIEELADKIGIEVVAIKSDDKKDIGSLFKRLSTEERKIFQSVIDDMFNRFVDVVDEGRDELSREEIRTLADGRIYTAEQALEGKLIDEIGYLDDAIKLAKKEAKIKDANVVFFHRPRDYKGNIYSSAGQSISKPQINIINVGLDSVMDFTHPKFYYLWSAN